MTDRSPERLNGEYTTRIYEPRCMGAEPDYDASGHLPNPIAVARAESKRTGELASSILSRQTSEDDDIFAPRSPQR